MHGTENPATIDELLRDARVLQDEYRDYEPPTAEERVARALARRGRRTAEAARDVSAPAAPNRATEHEQARHELDLAATLVLNTGRAAAYLEVLEDALVDERGALVFACLLHVTGRAHAARYWWQYAAGAGNSTAAFCLYLDHRRHAEYRDADFWRRQADRLRASPPPGARQELPSVPESSVRALRGLLAQCHRGRAPHLPPPLEGAISHLPVIAADEHDAVFGDVPSPHCGVAPAACA